MSSSQPSTAAQASTSATRSKKLFFHLLNAALALAISLLVSQFNLDNLEFFTYDMRFRIKPTSPVSGKIETITIDKETLKAFGSTPTAAQYDELLQKIAQHQPMAIVQLVRPNEIPGELDEIESFATTLKKLDNYYVPLKRAPTEGLLENHLYMPPPFDGLRYSLGFRTRDSVIFGKDKVTRRVLIEFRGRETMHSQIVRENFYNGQPVQFRGEFRSRGRKGAKQLFIDMHPAGTYPVTPFHVALRSSKDLSFVRDKIVIIGNDTETDVGDYIITPFSRKLLTMTNVEMHANMFDTMIQNRGLVAWPQWINTLLSWLIALITLNVVLRANPARGLLLLIGIIASFTLLTFLLFAVGGIFLGMIHTYVVIFICYYIFIPYRLIVENRRSWEYYQKHMLLKQVEELKSNFMSMMSHDIKTPLARIQGMIDVVMKEKETLTISQSDAIKTIRQSSEELSSFITSILDLGRVESQEIKLRKQSKDINALLKEVIQKHDFLARKKDIEIIPEFEPLFSVKVDVELIRQVLANLVENAIKYSPEGSKVLVSTEETENSVVVQVADQGKGIPTDELGNVFMKFYRSKDAKSSSTKGSGLGLYLAKYFVDLHGGKISAESEPGQGSTFTVELPVDNIEK